MTLLWYSGISDDLEKIINKGLLTNVQDIEIVNQI